MTNYVDAAFTKERLQDGTTKVINVLSPEDYLQRHLPGSLNVPADSPDFAEQVLRLVPDKSTAVVVHCSGLECQASSKAARRLESLGYKQVYDFKAGLQGWQDMGNPLESGPVTTPAIESSAGGARAERPPRPARERPVHLEEQQKPQLPPL